MPETIHVILGEIPLRGGARMLGLRGEPEEVGGSCCCDSAVRQCWAEGVTTGLAPVIRQSLIDCTGSELGSQTEPDSLHRK